jgi:SAM-dependent methyltransferase
MTQNKNHWYDGWFYDRIIAPNQDPLFREIKNLIEPHSKVIDVGCGTGRLAFALADHCNSVLGIDLSKRNIDRAQLTLLKQPNYKISFQHRNLSEISSEGQTHFDYAILTFVIHEVNENERIKLLNEIALVADQIIIGDYQVPKPDGFSGFLSKTIEFIAGREHYRNYKSYMANGGIYHLANRAELKIKNEILNPSATSYICVLGK